MKTPEGASYRPLIISLAWDIILNATIPLACYFFAKWFISPSELTALIFATMFPVLKSAYDLISHHELNPVAVLVLLGIAISILVIFLGGDPRILLVKESFFTGAFGIGCLLSLTFPRPIMFYFARYFMAAHDPQKRKAFNARWQNPIIRRTHRLVTAVWGIVYVIEFAVRITLVYTLPSAVVLFLSPFTNFATIILIIWSFWYGKQVQERLAT
jgi:hypothetical protein